MESIIVTPLSRASSIRLVLLLLGLAASLTGPVVAAVAEPVATNAAAPGNSSNRVIQFGSVPLVPGKTTVMEMRVNARAQSLMTGQGLARQTRARLGIAVPEGFDPQRGWPLF